MKTLRMTFGTPVANENLVLSLPYPKEGVTQAEIEKISGVVLADQYTIWGAANPKIVRR